MVLKLTTQQGMSEAGSDDFEEMSAPPAGTPDVDTLSKEQTAALLRQANAPGGSPPMAPPVAPVAPAAPEPGQDPLNQLPPEDQAVPGQKPEDVKPAEPKPDFTNIFTKFGIPTELQNNPAVLKMAGSYAESEKNLSQNFQAKSQAEKLTQENEQLLSMAEGFQKELNDARNAPAPTQPVDSNAPMTEREVEEYNANPKAAISRAVQEALKPIQQKGIDQQRVNEQDKVMDFKVNNALGNMKNDPAFSGLENDVNSILKQSYLDYDPRSVQLAYHAARSIRMPEIVNTAKNEGFTAGHAKAMDEIKRGVDGGKSTVPAEGTGVTGGFTDDQLNAMPANDLAKLIPNSGI